jgi:hypothetical protein
MRFTTLCVAVLAATGFFGASALAQDDPPPLHTEQGVRSRIKIETSTRPVYLVNRQTGDLIAEAGRYTYHKLIIDDVLHGSQVRKLERHVLDDFSCLTAKNPWDNIANAGALVAFDARQEPLTYHHRTGPIGAVYRELRTRNGGRDAKAPVAVMGMTAGTQACYALKGQKMTFYETDPVIVKLVADTDKYFSYIADARKRGAEIDVRTGNRRAKLKEDKDRKYALIVVDLAESFPVPTDVFTKEAVQEYFDRLTDDGLVVLHVSNKYLQLEPMFAKLAEELKLAARVWNDAGDRQYGKTASSWLVLARSTKALGSVIGSPLGDDLAEYGQRATLYDVIRGRYPELKEAAKQFRENQTLALVEWLESRPDDPRAKEYARLVRTHTTFGTIAAVQLVETGAAFRPIRTVPAVTAWTDERADVFILWMNSDLQRIRKLFGYPTLLEP